MSTAELRELPGLSPLPEFTPLSVLLMLLATDASFFSVLLPVNMRLSDLSGLTGLQVLTELPVLPPACFSCAGSGKSAGPVVTNSPELSAAPGFSRRAKKSSSERGVAEALR